jgi:hypothetical protein
MYTDEQNHAIIPRLVGPGFYTNPTDQNAYDSMVVAQGLNWYPLAVVQNLVRDLKGPQIRTQAGRDAALGIVNSIQTMAPYLIQGPVIGDIRFSSTANLITSLPNPLLFFIAGFCDGWDVIFVKLRSALEYKDRKGERASEANSATSEVDQSRSTPDPSTGLQQLNDTTVSLNWVIQTMEQLLRARSGVYNVRTFETKYGLTWTQTS